MRAARDKSHVSTILPSDGRSFICAGSSLGSAESRVTIIAKLGGSKVTGSDLVGFKAVPAATREPLPFIYFPP